MANRPLGVTIICLIGWIGALLSVAGGASLLGLGGMISTIGIDLAGFSWVIGAITIVIGLATILVLYWLWQMKKQGWKWVMVIEAISLIIALVQLNVLGAIFPAIVLIYLWMNKKLFR